MSTLIPTSGYTITTGRFIGTNPTQAEPKNVGWGIGTGTTAITDEALFTAAPEARVVGTSSQTTTTTTNDTYTVSATLTAAASETITNVGLFDTATAAPQTTLGGSGITTNTQATITVASASGFPTSGTYNIQILSEVLTVTGGQGTTTWTVTRGANGSTALTSAATGTYITGATSTTGGNLFLKSDFTGLPLNSGDSVSFVINTVVS